MARYGVGCLDQCADDPADWGDRWNRQESPHEKGDWGEEWQYWDEITGKRLDPKKVKVARGEELEFIDSKPPP